MGQLVPGFNTSALNYVSETLEWLCLLQLQTELLVPMTAQCSSPLCFWADNPISCTLIPVQPADVKKTALSLAGETELPEESCRRHCLVAVPVLYLYAARTRKLGQIWSERSNSSCKCSWGCSECMEPTPNARPCCNSLRSMHVLFIYSLAETSHIPEGEGYSHPGKALASLRK